MPGDTNRAGGVAEALSDQQRRLVQENIGLVMVHLRRNVGNLATPRRDREWEDLFQEGCLGLIRAALTFRPESGIPFAAFALPRIHNSVSRALQSKFATVYIPPARDNARRGDSAGVARRAPPQRVQVFSLSDEYDQPQANQERHDPFNKQTETVGQRLRGKYERAARTAAREVSEGVSRRGDREQLVGMLLKDRFLVPTEESRTALRQVARETKSSYARVSECDKQLSSAIRHLLEADPEFVELRRSARTSPEGTGLPIDKALERTLATASADEFITRFHTSISHERAAVLESLLAVADDDFDEVFHDRVAGMSSREREQLLHHCRPRQR
ncbi:MAG: hypothetical protein IID41_08295 [Planctomycetes bacterium]|nr:hypothetical protein [Planctomycetota bacterium]